MRLSRRALLAGWLRPSLRRRAGAGAGAAVIALSIAARPIAHFEARQPEKTRFGQLDLPRRAGDAREPSALRRAVGAVAFARWRRAGGGHR